MKNRKAIILMLLAATVSPQVLWAQSSELAGDIQGLQSVLNQLYQQMLPLCTQLIGVGRGIAGFAAIWYIASRV